MCGIIKKKFETYKIKRIIEAYNLFKRENPDISEDGLCRRLIVNRLYITRGTNNRKIKTIEDADYVVQFTFRDKNLDIEETCAWLMCDEYQEDLFGVVMSKISKNKDIFEFFQKKQEKRDCIKAKVKEIKNKRLKII